MKKHKELRRCIPPFSDCYASGPVLDKSHGRLNIKLLGKWGGDKKTSKTYLYSRYLLCAHLGKTIPKGFDVDHIDGNKRNDTIPNLVAVPHIANLKKRKTDVSTLAQHRYVRMVCLHCSGVFIKHRNQTLLTKKTQHATYCSMACSRHAHSHQLEQQLYEEFQIAEVPSEVKFEIWEDWSEPLAEKPKRERVYPTKECWCRYCGNKFSSQNIKTKYCSEECKAKGPSTRKDNDPAKNGVILAQACSCSITWTKAGKLLGISDNAAKKRARKLGLVIPVRKEKLID